eukprot:CAMPEP_0202728722 /NCGR_PEP_ID=MMETSP1385-20130828/185768_1 /ASSEMBLY_ACC=CAM_ASM_000861 /TAXON_ID=933848 /ORGANISM="Elphidium margaritaceum" /LENGTH=539 /DNA_ID=CAMNT_0049394973 /DNA_START=1257 /DNA_END=2876 /DNA_ORIENTATION=-
MLDEIDQEIGDEYSNKENNRVPSGVAALSFVPQQNRITKISQLFTFKKQLGCGASCCVLLVEAKDKSETLHALKEMQKRDAVNRRLFAQEYKVLNILKEHPNIVSFHSCYIDKCCYYIATQYCSGGTMLDRILRQKYFNEQQCSEFMKNVLFGIEHIHQHHIVHRDIKCQNLIFDKTGKDGVVKIIDFGNSELITNPNGIDNALIGSLHYLPPELLQSEPRTKRSLYKGDMWALGVVCYILVTGKVPFYGKNTPEMLKSIKRAAYDWPSNIQLSDSCKDFISKLLQKDIEKRMSVDEALQHEWIVGHDSLSSINFGDCYLSQIQLFLRANKLQKVLMNSALAEMKESDKRLLWQALRDLDLNGSGKVAKDDLINYILCQSGNSERLKQLQVQPTEIYMTTLDVDDVLGQIDIKEDHKAQVQPTVQEQKSETVFVKSFSPPLPVDDVTMKKKILGSTRISIVRFSQLMQMAEKKYDIAPLVQRLQPTDSGFIPIQNINGFNGVLHSVQSNDLLLNQFVKSGLDALDAVESDVETAERANL